MPITMQLEAIPVQEIEYTHPGTGARFIVTVRQLDSSIVVVTISRNGVVLCESLRAAAMASMIPFEYLDEGYGSFYFQTPYDELPNYEKFGSTHFLLYVTPEELAYARS